MEKKEIREPSLGLWATAALKIVGLILSSIRDILYDIALFPLATLAYRAIFHIPILGPTLTDTIDGWLEKLSQDWPEKLRP
ncbi:MAG: hypothetical protein NZ651_06820 [Candidatus Bipolaricaulota bacterium]|nr:hypothetical protein [Candidatus Bipolaricaulota bacterium]MDW8127467.1 hypothetical protein [Candidatus Bipolaricaulota bacterium]